jgi:hypothetical protein
MPVVCLPELLEGQSAKERLAERGPLFDWQRHLHHGKVGPAQDALTAARWQRVMDRDRQHPSLILRRGYRFSANAQSVGMNSSAYSSYRETVRLRLPASS